MKVNILNKLSVKVIFVILFVLIGFFALHTYLTVHNINEDITNIYRQNAYSLSDVIKRSTRYSMMLNKREDVYQIIRTIGNEPGVKGIKIYNKTGKIIFSTDSTELNKTVDIQTEACSGCHGKSAVRSSLPENERYRIYTGPGGEKILGLINPIKNEKDCSSAECHAHSQGSAILGVLDVLITMKDADDAVLRNKENIIFNAIGITLIISILSGVFITFMINKPVRKLEKGIEEIGKGNLNYKIHIRSNDELGKIAKEFNEMSRKLYLADKEIKDWSDNLNDKVEQKTQELKNIYEQVVQIEKLASLGMLSATVAHELNNPLEGILTYSKLISKKLKEYGNDGSGRLIEYLSLISDESARCGKIVKDLLLFSHQGNEEFTKCDLIQVIDKSLALIAHHFQINNIKPDAKYASGNFEAYCDPQKIQQALISMMINAVESMSNREGTVSIRLSKEGKNNVIRITDEGAGISEKDLPHIFDPFYTTKEAIKGTGLGLSVVYGIIKSHKGKVEVEKTSSSGTTMKISLPRP